MTTYIIAFDSNQVVDYKGFQQAVDNISFGAWIKPTHSQFIIRTSQKSEQIRDALGAYLPSSDQFFVARIDLTDWASRGVSNEIMGALKDKFF